MPWRLECRHICLPLSTAAILLGVYFISALTSSDYQPQFTPVIQTASPTTDRQSQIPETGSDRFKFNPRTKAYELNGKPIIWRYWNTEHMPLYVRLFTEAMHCRNPEFEIVLAHQSDVYKLLPDLQVPEELFKLMRPSHQADVFRLAVLLKYGGVWTDIDVYPLDKIYPLYDLLTKFDLVIGDSGQYDLAQCGMGPSRANVSLFRVWHGNQVRALQEYFPNGEESYKALPPSSLPYMSMISQTEYGLDKEVESNRTKILRYSGTLTNDQLVEKDLAQYSHMAWRETSPRFLPLNWTPFLVAWGLALRELYSDITEISELMPEEETMYSAFIGCALMDCREEYSEAKVSGVKVTRTTGLDLAEVLNALQRVNRSICESVRKAPVNEIDNYE